MQREKGRGGRNEKTKGSQYSGEIKAKKQTLRGKVNIPMNICVIRTVVYKGFVHLKQELIDLHGRRTKRERDG